MSAILDPPTAVLSIGGNRSTEDRLRRAIAGVDDAELVAAESAESATDVYQDRRYDIGCVVVSDDVADPVDACERIRGRDPSIPVVVLAANGNEDLAVETTRAGATTYLSDDVTDDALAETVERCLETCRRRRVTDEESRMFQALVENVNTAIFAKDAEGRHLRMTEVEGGVDQDTVIGKTDLEVYGHDPDAAKEFYEDDMAVVESGEPIFERVESSGPPGNRHWGKTTKVPWYDGHGEIRGLVGISIGITEQKRAERRLASLEERFESFASQLRHDLKSPLQVATGYLEVAQQTGDEDAFEKVDRALRRTEEIVDDMSTLAVDQGTIADEATPLDLYYEAREVWQFIATGDATFELETPRGTLVHASEEAIRPILENLLRNAVVHAGADATIRLGTTEDGFYVADDGPGIPPEDRERVLEEGYTTSASGQGTGLSIVADIAADRNWDVDVGESDSGGARVDVRGLLVVPERDRSYEPASTIELTDDGPIGGLGIEGSATHHGDTDRWTLTAGKDVDREERDFYLATTTVEGPVRLEARIADVEHVHDFSEGGLMVRDSNDLEVPFGFVGRTVGQGTELLWRSEHGGDVDQSLTNDEQTYPWYRIERVGDRITCSVSTDGKYWIPLDQRRIALEDPVQVGLAACSVVPGEPCEATFADVEVRELTER